MSRALNIDASQDDVTATCLRLGAAISTIETLPGGCTRVVLCSADGAAFVQRQYRGKIITTPMARTPLSIAARGIPITFAEPPAPPVPTKKRF